MKRKGFSFVVKSTDVKTESLPFDAFDNSQSQEKRRSKSDNLDKVKVKVIDNTMNDKPSSLKVHYPKIDLTNLTSVKKSKSNKDSLAHLIKHICKLEKDGLQSFFDSVASSFNRAVTSDMLQNLVDVLSLIEHDVKENCPSDVIFFPEISTKKQKMDPESLKLKTELVNLKSILEALTEYEDQIQSYTEKVSQTIPQKSSEPQKLGSEYLTSLHQMDTKTEELSNILEKVDQDIQTASLTKTNLFNIFQASYLSTSKSTDTTTKEIVKVLQSL